ncbi:hypothetical protein [Sedimentimonas flavescens]|uniref:hypothetical protein n=1 Tax=Sedimentimonas flavescens TaxID=2851012 RepID=UPI001C49ED28|nr:hypothetical protein [Sedimentimonas flavescens]MBW0156670.1 hypothetical protein [Sedimentimonas flavescens]
MTRLLLLVPFLLSACVEGASQPGQARMDQVGTCFAVVTAEEGGTYALATGVGDGSRAPLGQRLTGLSAAGVDAALAKERKIMDINPECLAIYVKDRAQAAPFKPGL